MGGPSCLTNAREPISPISSRSTRATVTLPPFACSWHRASDLQGDCDTGRVVIGARAVLAAVQVGDHEQPRGLIWAAGGHDVDPGDASG